MSAALLVYWPSLLKAVPVIWVSQPAVCCMLVYAQLGLALAIVKDNVKLCCVSFPIPYRPVGSIRAAMVVWEDGRLSELCCIVCYSCTHWYAYIHDQFVQIAVGLGLDLISVFFCIFSLLGLVSLCYTYTLGPSPRSRGSARPKTASSLILRGHV